MQRHLDSPLNDRLDPNSTLISVTGEGIRSLTFRMEFITFDHHFKPVPVCRLKGSASLAPAGASLLHGQRLEQNLSQISKDLKKLHSNGLTVLNEQPQMVCLAFLLLNDLLTTVIRHRSCLLTNLGNNCLFESLAMKIHIQSCSNRSTNRS